MSTQFVWDGHNYSYRASTIRNSRVVSVCDSNNNFVGCVSLYHDTESGMIERPNGEQDSVNYYHFDDMTNDTIASWIVATSY